MFHPNEASDSREEQDFLIRLIKQIIRALAHIVGLRTEGKPAEALAEIHDAYRSLLDLDPFLAGFLDGETLARFAEERGTRRELGLLIEEEAKVREALGDWGEAARLKEKAEVILRPWSS